MMEQRTRAEQRVRESESQRNRGIRDSDDTYDSHELPRLSACVGTLQDAARMALADKGPGDPVFKYARAVKAFELTVGRRLPKGELPAAFAVWWNMAKPELPGDADYDEYLFLFMEGYDKAKTPLGSNVIQNALARVESSSPPPEASRFKSPKIVRLVHLCHELQVISGDAPFFLSVRDAARAVDCKRYETAAAFLNGLVRDGILKLVARGSSGGHRASRFKYNFSESKE